MARTKKKSAAKKRGTVGKKTATLARAPENIRSDDNNRIPFKKKRVGRGVRTRSDTDIA